jgi:hypothetical protein
MTPQMRRLKPASAEPKQEKELEQEDAERSRRVGFSEWIDLLGFIISSSADD